MPKFIRHLCICFVTAFFVGCSKRTQVSNSDYSVVQPQSWNPDGHPGIFLYYKRKSIWFNVYCPNYGYHNGTLVFEGDVPDSLFNGTPTGNESADWRSLQIFAIRGSEPPVLISEQVLKQSLKTELFRVDHFSPATNGLNVSFSFFGGNTERQTNVFVSWEQVQAWLKDAEATAPIKNSRMGPYRYLPLK